ncbi:hypothetical protein LWI29_014376 [Acer saccharum]|uniref:Uncharacterized protein n=1 Tax=Acer saccharum TaxID=4024 RepID=A0AA39RCM3_ACESA|nr:hypothetical protein LWI29_014376 [Acer saccharum]
MHSSFLPIASLLLSIWGFVALTTAIEFPENLAIWKLKFVCCSMLKQYVLANDFHSNHQFETPYSTLHYFSPIACLLLSTCGFVALITANISRESHSMENGFVCCSASLDKNAIMIFQKNRDRQIAAALVSHRRGFHSTNLKGTH